MMAERGTLFPGAHDDHALDPTHYAPEFEKRWNRFARPAGRSWRVDETYVKPSKRRWTYLYRAVDKEGRTVDFLLRAKRDVAAAKAFFRLAFRRQGRLPLKITPRRLSRRPHIAQPKRPWTNIPREINARSDRQNI